MGALRPTGAARRGQAACAPPSRRDTPVGRDAGSLADAGGVEATAAGPGAPQPAASAPGARVVSLATAPRHGWRRLLAAPRRFLRGRGSS
jgi:hypothetical protein